MYKAFNTFIDDVFSFIMVMPTSHRIACLRDDVVFFVYLYQWYLYPVDKTRANEYGYAYEEEEGEGKGEAESGKEKADTTRVNDAAAGSTAKPAAATASGLK